MPRPKGTTKPKRVTLEVQNLITRAETLHRLMEELVIDCIRVDEQLKEAMKEYRLHILTREG